MQGIRQPDGSEWPLPPGSYWRSKSGVWMAVTPKGHIGDLRNHDVIEHEDGTITVSTSILVPVRTDKRDQESWYGFLERGIWREI